LKLKCAKFDFGAPPQIPLEELTAFSRPLAGVQDILLREREERREDIRE